MMPHEPRNAYNEDNLPQFTPMQWCSIGILVIIVPMLTSHRRTLQEIRAAIPSHLFVADPTRGFLYLARDASMAALAWKLATLIDPFFLNPAIVNTLTSSGAETLRWCAWAV